MRRPDQVPCVFRTSFIREQIDPRIKAAWPGRAPWGDLRKTWKTEYCLRVNPTGYPEDCPFSEEDCALTFLQAVLIVTEAERPGALFRRVAATRGMERADQRPLARDRVPQGRPLHLGETSTVRDVVRPMGPGEVGAVAGSESKRNAMSRRGARPISIGEVLGALDFGARQGSAQDGEEGPG